MVSVDLAAYLHAYILCSHISDQFMYEANVFIKGE